MLRLKRSLGIRGYRALRFFRELEQLEVHPRKLDIPAQGEKMVPHLAVN